MWWIFFMNPSIWHFLYTHNFVLMRNWIKINFFHGFKSCFINKKAWISNRLKILFILPCDLYCKNNCIYKFICFEVYFTWTAKNFLRGRRWDILNKCCSSRKFCNFRVGVKRKLNLFGVGNRQSERAIKLLLSNFIMQMHDNNNMKKTFYVYNLPKIINWILRINSYRNVSCSNNLMLYRLQFVKTSHAYIRPINKHIRMRNRVFSVAY
jgi:hypothetical protein